MNIVTTLYQSFLQHQEKNAVFEAEDCYTYGQFLDKILAIRLRLRDTDYSGQQIFGLWITDDMPCYASIIALWFEGKAYVPLNPESPYDRNLDIIQQAGLKTILSAVESKAEYDAYRFLYTQTAHTAPVEVHPEPDVPNSETLMYILFTSGTTGRPKGVPVKLYNLEAFVSACNEIELDIDENDRCLQMFNMTFDMSIMSYLLCFLAGACLYPIPKDKIKYQYVYELMDDQKLTVAFMVPSILHYLRPYFSEIFLPYLRYSLFAGEALLYDVTEEWSKSVPNAQIINAYGPTENTIICTWYTFQRDGVSKTYNGILSIGLPMPGNDIIIVDDSLKVLPIGEAGQMCLGGPQLTPGYWNNDEKNKEAFFEMEYKGQTTRFYKSGDLCKMDAHGDIFYSGRLDFQAKIQGFRVELSEIEYHCKAFLENVNLLVVAFTNRIGNSELGLAIEGETIDLAGLFSFLKLKMPPYMIPTRTIFAPTFPLSAAGKTDRKSLAQQFAQI